MIDSENTIAVVDPMGSARSSALICKLELLGLGEFLSAFDPTQVGTHDWMQAREEVSGDLGVLVDFFLLSKEVSRERMLEILPEGAEFYDSEMVSVPSVSMISLPNFVLATIGGVWVWVQKPTFNSTIYIGHDTFGLLSRIRCYSGERALDLCSGPGTQGIYMASKGANVTAVERNAVAAQVAQANVSLNGVGDRMQVRIGDLYAALGNSAEQFDIITANPPLLPFPDNHFYPFVGHGGEDGLSVTWRIIDGLPTWLKPTGRAQIIGTAISDGFLPTSMARFKRYASQHRLSILMTIVGHADFLPGASTFEGILYTALSAGAKTTEAEMRKDLTRIVAEVDGSHLCTFSLHITHGTGGFHVLNLSSAASRALWFR